ncbi:MAG: polysaccharide biosynthesis tyrosine autokinase [Acidimicrobiales bacterium]
MSRASASCLRASLNATLASDQTQLIQSQAPTNQGGAQILAPAPVPSTPTKPHPKRTAAEGLAVGIVLAFGLAFLVDYLDNRVRGQDDLVHVTGGLPVLGLIPPTPGWRDGRVARVISVEDPAAEVSEAYRRLRTSIQFLALDRSLKTIQVTSPWKSEGKTTTVVNLAVTLARSGQRVIVVDCDLRRPRIAEFFHLSSRVGFTSVLLGDAPLSRALQPVEGVEGLRVLPAGVAPPNPSELLSGKRTREILERLAADADCLLIDSPPVLPVSDAAVIAGLVDGVLVVVNDNSTKRKQLQRAMELLTQVGSTVAGLVLNRTHQDEGSYEYGYGSRAPEATGRRRSRGADRPASASTSPPSRKHRARQRGGSERDLADSPEQASPAGGERRVKKPVNVTVSPRDTGSSVPEDL